MRGRCHGVRLGVALLVCAMVGSSCVAAEVDADMRQVPRPSELPAEIALNGLDSPSRESWVRMESGLPPGAGQTGVGNLGRPELWVWNVSSATLTPFLPSRARASGAAMIVMPGGAFMGLAIDREGFAIARWLCERGIAAFVLKYRVAPLAAEPHQALIEFNQRMAALASRTSSAASDAHERTPTPPAELVAAIEAARADGAAAIRYVRAHADEWHLSAQRIGAIGFSAGAVTVLGVALEGDLQSRPDLVASIYGVLPSVATVPQVLPPAFVAAAADDAVGPASLNIFETWHGAHMSAELHVLENGGHGFGMTQQNKQSDEFPGLLEHWLIAHDFERRGRR
jgi:acetyl esterase/lipase